MTKKLFCNKETVCYYKWLFLLIYSHTASRDIFQMRPMRKAFISPEFSRRYAEFFQWTKARTAHLLLSNLKVRSDTWIIPPILFNSFLFLIFMLMPYHFRQDSRHFCNLIHILEKS